MVPSLRPNKCRISASNCLKGDPEVEISDVVFDVLMGLALQGVGRALKPFTESNARELSGAAVRYASMRSNVRFAKVLAALMKSADTDKCSIIFEQEEMGPALRIRPSHIRKYNEAVREIVNEGVANRLETITGEEPRRFDRDSRSPCYKLNIHGSTHSGVPPIFRDISIHKTKIVSLNSSPGSAQVDVSHLADEKSESIYHSTLNPHLLPG